MWAYIVKIGNSLSQLLNVVFLNGEPDECLSGRAYRTDTRWAIVTIDTIFFWDEDHCKSAYMNDLSYAGKVLARHKELT